jgi:hypothetical protein
MPPPATIFTGAPASNSATKLGVGDQAGIHLAAAQEGHLFGEGRRDHEVQHHAVVLGGLQRIRQEVVEVAEARPVRGLDVRLGRVRRALAECKRQGARRGGAQEAAPVEPRRAQLGHVDRTVFTHGDTSCAGAWVGWDRGKVRPCQRPRCGRDWHANRRRRRSGAAL